MQRPLPRTVALGCCPPLTSFRAGLGKEPLRAASHLYSFSSSCNASSCGGGTGETGGGVLYLSFFYLVLSHLVIMGQLLRDETFSLKPRPPPSRLLIQAAQYISSSASTVLRPLSALRSHSLHLSGSASRPALVPRAITWIIPAKILNLYIGYQSLKAEKSNLENLSVHSK